MALTGRPQRRDRLCELFWNRTDDPRGALRWSLSKIRPLLNDEKMERLFADRERVAFTAPHSEIDARRLHTALDQPDVSVDALLQMRQSLQDGLLTGLDLPELTSYQAWLVAEREEASRLLDRIASRIALSPDLDPKDRIAHAQYWYDLSPFDATAANCLISATAKVKGKPEAATLKRDIQARFAKAGVEWRQANGEANDQPTYHPVLKPERQLLLRQSIQFCRTKDNVSLAYATVGQGKPIIKAANWLSHLELDWDAPFWSPLFRHLAEDHFFVRYDERGNGLSDWDAPELSFETFVTDLEAVVDATCLDRFPLLGISQGAAVSIEYAVRHPERVTKFVLFGGYMAGWRIGADDETIAEREALITLTRAGWGKDNPAYRQIFSSTFMPTATADEMAWFNEFQRRTTSPDMAIKIMAFIVQQN